MFARGNSKLGPSVFAFGIPAKRTCPGATRACAAVCYAAAGRYHSAAVRKSLERNWERTRAPDFARAAAAELVTKGARLVRVHTAGDLYSVAYAEAWVRVMRACPEVRFWLYTRSWRRPEFRPVLRRMAALPNVRLWFSADADSGVPRARPARVRVAWLMAAPGDEPPAPVDLVFRTKGLRRAARASVAGAPVCPTETGLPGAERVTCDTCRRCAAPLPGDGPGRRIPLGVVA